MNTIEVVGLVTLGVIIAPVILITLYGVLVTWIGFFTAIKHGIAQRKQVHAIKHAVKECHEAAEEFERAFGMMNGFDEEAQKKAPLN